LIFYPDIQELTLYRHTGKKYVSVKPNKQGRYPVPELDLEVSLEGGWVRYWYEGALLPLPADLDRDLEEAKRRVARAVHWANAEARRANEEAHRAAEFRRQLEAEQEARRAAEAELAQFRAALERQSTRRGNGPKSDK
jgi:hypothetical protein